MCYFHIRLGCHRFFFVVFQAAPMVLHCLHCLQALTHAQQNSRSLILGQVSVKTLPIFGRGGGPGWAEGQHLIQPLLRTEAAQLQCLVNTSFTTTPHLISPPSLFNAFNQITGHNCCIYLLSCRFACRWRWLVDGCHRSATGTALVLNQQDKKPCDCCF